jgi:dinuclear metal center YbgI/SA1388 family protein
MANMLSEVVTALERFAPLPLQEDYDNAGLQVGLTEEACISGALLCVDVTPQVLDEAVRVGANVVVAHHPVLFHPLRSLTGCSPQGQLCLTAARRNIAIYAAHTNWDNAPRGVNYAAAELLGLSGAVSALTSLPTGGGAGIIGSLPAPMSEEEFVVLVSRVFATRAVRHNEFTGRTIQRVAFCGGSGASLIPDAMSAGADVFVTGEISYHHWGAVSAQTSCLTGGNKGMLLIEGGHYETERHVIDLFYKVLHEALPDLPLYKTKLNTNPIIYT